MVQPMGALPEFQPGSETQPKNGEANRDLN
jgi:hypothetical protein